jgi:hypothetical protein
MAIKSLEPSKIWREKAQITVALEVFAGAENASDLYH